MKNFKSPTLSGLWSVQQGLAEMKVISRTNVSQHRSLSGSIRVPWKWEKLEGSVEVQPSDTHDSEIYSAVQRSQATSQQGDIGFWNASVYFLFIYFLRLYLPFVQFALYFIYLFIFFRDSLQIMLKDIFLANSSLGITLVQKYSFMSVCVVCLAKMVSLLSWM